MELEAMENRIANQIDTIYELENKINGLENDLSEAMDKIDELQDVLNEYKSIGSNKRLGKS